MSTGTGSAYGILEEGTARAVEQAKREYREAREAKQAELDRIAESAEIEAMLKHTTAELVITPKGLKVYSLTWPDGSTSVEAFDARGNWLWKVHARTPTELVDRLVLVGALR